MRHVFALLVLCVLLIAPGCRIAGPNADREAVIEEEIETLLPDDTVPATEWHTMAPGDTFYSIARRCNVSVGHIIALNPEISDPRSIPVGARIRIPTGRLVEKGATSEEPPDLVPQPAEPDPNTPFSYGTGFIRPVPGDVLRRFGEQVAGEPTTRSRGVELRAPAGAPVRAARGGRVVVRRLPEYGDVIVINHDNNMSSFYGHLSRLMVRGGQSVSQGDVIAFAGGRNCIHFRVTRNGRPVDPAALIRFP